MFGYYYVAAGCDMDKRSDGMTSWYVINNGRRL